MEVSPDKKNEYLVSDEDLAKLAVARQSTWYFITLAVYFLCAGLGFAMAILVMYILAHYFK
ncbi:MAG: hypothetical protein NTW79_01410 [Candidatus Berkelbacteria bacterium]|nr:hypothetical protein [Candidatus Berkelbacteria bacterium]